ncbi:hypothetical protein CKOHBEJN_00401 [Aeromonas hydrophila]
MSILFALCRSQTFTADYDLYLTAVGMGATGLSLETLHSRLSLLPHSIAKQWKYKLESAQRGNLGNASRRLSETVHNWGLIEHLNPHRSIDHPNELTTRRP